MAFDLGNTLTVDLTTEKITITPAEDTVLRNYIGGCGYGAYILSRTLPEPPDPLAPESPLVISCGPISGTPVPTSGRHTIIARSPLTGLWGEASIGGSWGRELRRAGFLNIVITGRASRPVYLWISPDGVELRDARDAWGLECEESDSMLKSATDPNAVVSTIGPSGERCIAISGIFTNGSHARVAARCGLGAVQGSKRLKAIVVKGRGKVPIKDPAALRAVTKPLLANYRTLAERLGKFGTPNLVHPCADIGTMPFQNWRQGKWDGADKISGEELHRRFSSSQYRCAGCPIGCGRVVKLDGKEMGGPEYETLALIGGACLIDDLESICRLNRRCNQLGIDTMEAGSLVAYAMELYEKGLISRSDADGADLTWGNAAAAGQLIEQMGRGEGLGALLGKGVKATAEKLGGLAEEYALHVKGMAPAAHDPRAYFSIALGYATSNRGACHLQAFSHIFERNVAVPEWGMDEPLDRLEPTGKALLVMRAQDLMGLFDSVAMCKFSMFSGVTPKTMTDWINAITGWEFSAAELMQCGERIFNLKRLYNNHLGISRKDDTLPGRFLTHKRGEGGTVKSLPPLNVMLSDYYELRGWSEEGIPRFSKLSELGIENWAL